MVCWLREPREDYDDDYREIVGDYVGYWWDGPGCVPLHHPIFVLSRTNWRRRLRRKKTI